MAVEDGRQRPGRISQPVVIVLDNNADTVAFTCSALATASIAAEGCPYNTRALAYIRHKRPDVILLTSPLEDDPEYRMFNSLRSDPATETIRIVFVSKDIEQLCRKIAVYDSSMVQFLASPYTLDALIGIVAGVNVEATKNQANGPFHI